MRNLVWGALVLSGLAVGALGQDVTIRVDASRPGHPISRYLTGACIEDVNHEIYGGLYSQMIFGESFQEPAPAVPVKNFSAMGGEWKLQDGQLHGGQGSGPLLVSTAPPTVVGKAGVELYLPGQAGGNAGLVVRLSRPAPGADDFDGYEVSIDVARNLLIVGRHQHNFRLLKEATCDVAADRWISLCVKVTQQTIEALVDGKSVVRVEDPHPLPPGTIALRQWQRPAVYRNLWVETGEGRTKLPFEAAGTTPPAVSGMWRPVQTGTARLEASIEKDHPFVGAQSQRMTFVGGQGDAGIENEGLNHSGLAFHKDKPYDGYLWLRAKQPTSVIVSLESRDGSHAYARHTLTVSGDDWKRYDFVLTPAADEECGRFAIRLSVPGSIDVGHAFLEPGEWGRFKGLPDRRDVAEALVDQGITILRYGGSMANAAEYRWKKMIGPRDRRPPYHGTWYPYASNGWGIIDFLNFCESAGFLGIPDFNIDETPQDMADFIEYVNGDANTEWGRKRAADGHPAPYHLRHLELGNEEKVNDTYYQKFEKITQAIWAKGPNVVPVVGDFQYERPITDPMHISGAASRITSLAAQKKILDLVRQGGHEVWFDVHLGTQAPSSTSVRSFKSYVDAIDQLADGAKHHVVVFEFNANTHDQLRAISNADEIAAIMRDGRVPVCLSANCLQVDAQNDNGWNQGLLFVNQTKVWLQPPGYVTQMFAKNYEPLEAETSVEGGAGELRATATRSEDGKRLVLFVVNLSHNPIAAGIDLGGFVPSHSDVTVQELAGPPEAVNTATDSTRIVPRTVTWKCDPKQGPARRLFPPTSVTVMAFE
ncbi:MAG TPA: family 16 glycoside hydrolase [Tepidisphaeraceae bacterium]|nr:family 16 glycoside hydrolase [Tepidisphaeraceae bacterium]